MREDYSDTVEPGSVIEQKPAADTPVAKASTVELTVSLGYQPTPTPLAKDRTIVPSVIGLSNDEARRRIESAGLTNTYPNLQGPGDIPDADLRKVQPGQVLSQQPAAGTVVELRTTVYLAVRK